ncbi:MAG: DNA modification methylase [Candidatus Hydrogenedentes bacterium CG07_land_8_20_14_0_80_42_17]|nr:MAG: DNA modification methylase [Candidatus Hydrogenedentes bacterium CG07_land_8_20_14_0_80_42_17]
MKTELQKDFIDEIKSFKEFGKKTQSFEFKFNSITVPFFVNEFWTSRQRQAHSLHEISYRACFKPQLPRFFITRLTREGDTVYDPFMGRGTTLLESALLGRIPFGCDVNPISTILVRPRLFPPAIVEIEDRIKTIGLNSDCEFPEELLVFYHSETLKAVVNLKNYILDKESEGKLDPIDSWIRMVATNRLTGHSNGFFSVYTLPPNQAVSMKSQQRINTKRGLTPPLRDVKKIILKKSRNLLKDLTEFDRIELERVGKLAKLETASCDKTEFIEDETVSLVVTSPPFLNEVNYKTDNWLRCWFNGIDAERIQIWQIKNISEWQSAMQNVFVELCRILKPGGYVAFEVGEVRSKTVKLEELVLPAGIAAGLTPLFVLINEQVFTKTSNCWGIDNSQKGTNTNRIVLFQKK